MARRSLGIKYETYRFWERVETVFQKVDLAFKRSSSSSNNISRSSSSSRKGGRYGVITVDQLEPFFKGTTVRENGVFCRVSFH
jgi:hypothetical protein